MKPLRLVIISIVLASPVIFFSIHQYFAHDKSLTPTGFIQGDDVVYMSNARQYLESSPNAFYSNPFSLSAKSPKIYTQPYNYILLAFLYYTHIPPGWILLFFGLLCAILCIAVLIKLVNEIYPDLQRKNLVYLLIVWGGGVTAISGLVANVSFLKGRYTDFWSGIYMVDPGNGWWGMNFGRILFISLEAYYHLLFIGGIFLLVRQKWFFALLVAFLLSWSHPFTGVEYLLIVTTWLLIEKTFLHNKPIPWKIVLLFIFLLGLHLFYYLYFLNQFPEHDKLFKVFSVDWGYSYRVYLPAYLLVFLLAGYTIYFLKWKTAFHYAHQRLFFVWALVSFLLSNHEWFMKPMQPIHFARGYVWLGLFLFGLPGLIRLMESLGRRKFLLTLFVLLFLSDNILWFGNSIRSHASSEDASYIGPDTKQLLLWLQQNSTSNDLIVSNEELVSYLANAYASSFSLASHPYNTPDYYFRKQQQLDFFDKGVIPAEWRGRRLLIIVKSDRSGIQLSNQIERELLFENNSYQLFVSY